MKAPATSCATKVVSARSPMRPARVQCKAAVADEGTSIRRRPPMGVDKQPCGPIAFQVEVDDDNAPRNILEEIVWSKTSEIEKWRLLVSPAQIRARAMQAPPSRDFKAAILGKLEEFGKPGLIAEVKKASPSRGIIQPDFDPVKIAAGYEAGGAACLSVLTDRKYFQGSFENLTAIRSAGNTCPLLCKEFIVDAYQIMKARAAGADAVLLIAAVLPNSDISYFCKAAASLGMVCLVEVHTEAELTRVLRAAGIEDHILGINNRDLGTFEVDLLNTQRIMESAAGQEVLERGIPMIGESGIFTPEHVAIVQASGCKGILVGESIVKQGDQEAAVRTLLSRE
eukprot:jgi/Ulvmu1/3868/UM018_0087.1